MARLCLLVLILLTAVPGSAANNPPPPPPPPPAGVIAEGWVVSEPDAHVELSAEVTGRIERAARETTRVKRGDLLVQLDARTPEADLAEARALLAEATADTRWQQREVLRLERVHSKGSVSDAALDRARHDSAAARARRDRAAATERRMELVVSRSRILAPFDGIVLSRVASVGEYVRPGSPLLVLADPARSRVEAEVDEYDANRIHLGATAQITAVGFHTKAFTGQVVEIAPRLGRRAIRPQDPARPLDTRVLPVRISVPPGSLKLGQRVEVRIATAAR
jgi:RND family efflux transporter MFP subunit